MTTAASASRAVVWWEAARPRTLPAAAAPVLLGTAVAIATGGFQALPALAALAAALLIQVGTNFANDVFDAEKGADGPDRVGPLRAVSAGLVTARAMRWAMAGAFSLSAVFGAYLAAIGGWPVVAIGVASIAAGVLYTGGPYPLGYLGLGDVFVFVFFGLVAVAGTAFVQAGTVPALAWLAAVPAGLLATAVLVVNNVRDRETDARAGKHTLAVRLGRAAADAEYVGCVAGAFLCGAATAWWQRAPWPLLPVLLVPLAVRLVRDYRALDGRALNPLLGRTARLLMLYAVLEAAGIVLAGR